MKAPLLYGVAERGWFANDEAWMSGIEAVVAARRAETAVQVRAKGVGAAELAELAAKVRERIHPSPVLLFLNGPVELAERLGFEGVHWPESAIPKAGADLPASLAVGASVHSVGALLACQLAHAHFAVFGPVFAPLSKPGKPTGLEGLQEIVRAATVPVLAIGGVTSVRVRDCLKSGAQGVAAIAGIFGAKNVVAAIDEYLLELLLGNGLRSRRPLISAARFRGTR